MKPIFDRLCDRSLLGRCVLGATQNQNESFNNVVWRRCSKTDFASAVTVQIAVNLAVLTFNRGAMSVVHLGESLGVKPGPLFTNFFREADVFRQKRAELKASGVSKKARLAAQRRRTLAEDLLIAAEGSTYGAGQHRMQLGYGPNCND